MSNIEKGKEDNISLLEYVKSLNKEDMAEFLSFVYNSDVFCNRCITTKEGCYNAETEKSYCYSYILDLLDKPKNEFLNLCERK